ncbi:MAG: hypothetical protein JSR59_13070 [Proteobacteria bacterium]|nr:hypothetical protein [Pseudomonadota bacterium]
MTSVASPARSTRRAYLATIGTMLGQGRRLAGPLRAHAEALYAQGFPPDEAVHCLQALPPSIDEST